MNKTVIGMGIVLGLIGKGLWGDYLSQSGY